jgi:hypothetical protein
MASPPNVDQALPFLPGKDFAISKQFYDALGACRT